MRKLKKKFKYYLSEKNPVLLTKLMYIVNFRRRLNLNNPKDINEKLHYLKLYTYCDNDVITRCVDKYRVKEYLGEKNILGLKVANNYTEGMKMGAELLEVWDGLPDKFMIKCNHGCGFNLMVKDKKSENPNELAEIIDKWLQDDQWKMYCEPQYKNVEKCFFVEEFLGEDVEAYKFYCFNGEPKVSYVSSAGDTGIQDLYLDFYDMDWKWLDISLDGHKNMGDKIKKPENYSLMIEIARKLSAEFPFVRVDLYDVDDKVYFSELTFVPTGGNMKLTPKSVLEEWGKMLEL